MDVDLNNLRKQAAFALDDVIETLNAGIMPATEYAYHEIDGKKKSFQGNVLVSTEDLQEDIDYLRQCVWSLLCVYQTDDPLFQAVYEDVENNGGLRNFNDK